MRTRLLGIFGLLCAVLVLGLGVPLALSVSDAARQNLFVDRLAQATRFASEAQRTLVAGRPERLAATFARFEQVYGTRTLVVDAARRPVVGSPSPAALGDRRVRDALDAALAGQRLPRQGMLWPWSPPTMVLAQPVLVDGQLRGAVVTVSSTEHARATVLRTWLLIAAGAVLAFAVAFVLTLPLARWFLRPVRRVDTATGELTAAVLAGEPVPERTGNTGPPELRSLARSVVSMAEAVSAALAAQREFVADASHELRNPLTALRLRLTNLRDELAPDTPAAEQAEATTAEVDRLVRILDDLLAVARAESGVRPLQREDVAATVADRLAAWRGVAADRRVTLAGGGTSTAAVLVPRGGLAVILDALLDNAVKFTAGGSTVEVTVTDRAATGSAEDDTAGDAAETVVLDVLDRGPGLRPEELRRATDRFWRSPRDQNADGSGLGLAIVERTARRASGSVAAYNREGGGLHVRVTLPRAPDPGAEGTGHDGQDGHGRTER